jgi:hypothetical protein
MEKERLVRVLNRIRYSIKEKYKNKLNKNKENGFEEFCSIWNQFEDECWRNYCNELEKEPWKNISDQEKAEQIVRKEILDTRKSEKWY